MARPSRHSSNGDNACLKSWSVRIPTVSSKIQVFARDGCVRVRSTSMGPATPTGHRAGRRGLRDTVRPVDHEFIALFTIPGWVRAATGSQLWP